jgi:hypothetical protein
VDRKQQHFWIDRRHLRVNTEIPCQIRSVGDGQATARILNISVAGLKFCCDHGTIQNILPEDQQTPGQVLDVKIDIHFELLTATGNTAPVITPATIIHSERLAQDVFHVGVQFYDLDDSMLQILKTYIRDHNKV